MTRWRDALRRLSRNPHGHHRGLSWEVKTVADAVEERLGSGGEGRSRASSRRPRANQSPLARAGRPKGLRIAFLASKQPVQVPRRTEQVPLGPHVDQALDRPALHLPMTFDLAEDSLSERAPLFHQVLSPAFLHLLPMEIDCFQIRPHVDTASIMGHNCRRSFSSLTTSCAVITLRAASTITWAL